MRCSVCSYLPRPSTVPCQEPSVRAGPRRRPAANTLVPQSCTPKAGQCQLPVPSGVLPLVPFIPFLRGSCSPLPVPCGDSGLPESKFRGVVGGVSRQEGSVGAMLALGARPLPSCSCLSFSWSWGSPAVGSQGQPLVARQSGGLASSSGSAQPPGEQQSSWAMVFPRAAAGLSLTSRTSGVARASFLRRRKTLSGTPSTGACHTLPAPHHPACLDARTAVGSS